MKASPAQLANLKIFTSETAKAAAVNARKARAENKARRAAEEKSSPLSPEVREDLKIVHESIAQAREWLGDKLPCCPECGKGMINGRAQLLKALDTLLDRRRELMGRPRLAAFRQPKERQSRQPSAIPSPLQEPLQDVSPAQAA